MKAIFSVFRPRGTPWPKKRKNRLHFDVFFDPKFRLNPLGYRIDPKKHISAHPSAPPRDPPNPTICAAHPFGTPGTPPEPQRRIAPNLVQIPQNGGFRKMPIIPLFPQKVSYIDIFQNPHFFEIFPFIRMCFLGSNSVPHFNLI